MTYYLWLSPYSGRCVVSQAYTLTPDYPEEPGFERFLIFKRRLSVFVGIWPKPNEAGDFDYALFVQSGA